MTSAQELERRRRLHFYKRVRERIGRHVDAKILWGALVEQIENYDPDNAHIVFIARISRCGRRLWKFELNDRWYLVIFDHRYMHPVTILQPTGRLRLQGKSRSINLGAIL